MACETHMTHAGGTICGGFEANTGGGACARCGGWITGGQWHTCLTGIGVQWSNPLPSSLWNVQTCPVCEGRGNLPHGFYSRLTVATSTEPETCQTCDGKGILKVGIGGTVEKVN